MFRQGGNTCIKHRNITSVMPMSKKKPFVLRIDETLLAAVEKWAADEFRSTNGQLEWIIHQALQKNGRLKKGKVASNIEKDISKE